MWLLPVLYGTVDQQILCPLVHCVVLTPSPHFAQDGDGELTVEDAKYYWRKVKAVLTSKLPDAGGFSLGFLYGVKHG